METLTFTLAAGAITRFARAGGYFEIVAAAGRLNVEFAGQQEAQGRRWMAALAGFYGVLDYTALEITNAESFPQTVTIMVADKGGGSRRIVQTLTAVLDTKSQTQAGKWFSAGAQLNPAAPPTTYGLVLLDCLSSVPFALHQIDIAAGTGGMYLKVYSATAIASLATTGTPPVRNNLLGGANSANIRVREGTWNFTATGLAAHSGDVRTVVGNTMTWRPAAPVIVTPGNFLIIANTIGAAAAAAELTLHMEETV